MQDDPLEGIDTDALAECARVQGQASLDAEAAGLTVESLGEFYPEGFTMQACLTDAGVLHAPAPVATELAFTGPGLPLAVLVLLAVMLISAGAAAVRFAR